MVMPYPPTSPGAPSPPPTAATLAALRARIRQIERNSSADSSIRLVAPLGLAALDDHLPGGGLARGGLHEIEGERAEWDDGAATGFCLALLARLVSAGRILWVSRWGDLHGPGLAAYGLDPGRLILVRAETEAAVLWALEEGLRCPALDAVVGEIDGLERSAGRRLQLAAEASGVSALLLRRRLRPAGRAEPPSAALTRWRVAPLGRAETSGGTWPRPLGRAGWRVELRRCRGAAPGTWLLEWDDAAGGFALAAPVRDRPAAPAGAPADTPSVRRATG